MSINSISPIDGRYKSKTAALRNYFSEYALIKYRVKVEINYFIKLLKDKKVIKRIVTDDEIKLLSGMMELTEEDAGIVKKIETSGYEGIPSTNHDVKAVEYFIKMKLEKSSLKDVIELVHFSLTSEDINNLSYALMITEGFNEVIFPILLDIYGSLYELASSKKNMAMLARTHGQPASPTTFGKEILVFVNRMKEELALIFNIKMLSKLNGATGNYNSHIAVFPDIDWQKFSEELIEALINNKPFSNRFCSESPLKLSMNKLTTQIEPHDNVGRLFDSVKRINIILADFCCDIWRYISDGWITQKPVKGEVGSSTMPHKINPIDFENAEGNIGVANAMFEFFARKLPVSRLQRDLTDSTVLRNIGVAFAHSLIAYKSILKGMGKIEVDERRIKEALDNNPEVISEAYQNILRIAGVEKPYELMKEITRGKRIEMEDFHRFIDKINVENDIKEKLRKITPENYTGIAEKLVEEFDPKIK